MTAADKTARRVYSAEQLHKLRASCSAPKLREAIEEHDSEDAELVKEHVLRGSKSFAARSFRSRTHANSIQFASSKPNDENIAVFVDPIQEQAPPVIPSNKPQVLGEIANNGQAPRFGQWRLRTSPTPSIRKSKIEALVKHHGSPQHVRVTAGGRIVPSEQSPLCHPRFGYSAIKSNGALIKVAPNHIGKAQWTSATQDGFVAQDINGRLCQIVNGTIMPLNEEDGALRLYVPAPNITTQRGPSIGTSAAFEGNALPGGHVNDSQESFIPAPPPSLATQKNALDLEYSKLEQELRALEKTEVLHASTMSKPAKDALFTKRRELVTSMDRVRKSLKTLKDSPPEPQVPTSPKAMRDRHSLSPQRDRLPPFLQRARQSNSTGAPSTQGPWRSIVQPGFNADPSLQVAPPFGVSNMMNSNGPFSAMPYQMPPPGAFMPPPPFDGSMGGPFPAYSGPVAPANTAGAAAASGASNGVQAAEHNIPQQDGSSSSSDPKVTSPRLSRALPIKDPATRQITNVKSALNPMSPVYKPGSGVRQMSTMPAETTRDKPVHDSAPSPPLALVSSPRPVANVSARTTDESHISPMRKKLAVDSSSVSSVRTADFFPRNTREYSMRKHEYPIATDESGEREKLDPDCYRRMQTESHSPITPKRDLHNTNWNPDIPDGAFVKLASPQTGGYAAPTAPPGTPVNASGVEQRQQVLKFGSTDWDHHVQYLNDSQMPDRVAHNLSPKNKRTWRFVEEHPSRYSSEETSSPAREHQCREELCATSSPHKASEFTDKSRDWIEGHQAGLYRKPIGADRMGDYLDGYCAGLQKSQPVTAVSIGISDGSPTKPVSRRPTPSPGQSTPHQAAREIDNGIPVRPKIELSLQSLDSLKEAVYAPHNENALATPAVENPPSTELPYRLGAWQKRHENTSGLRPQYPSFPQRASSLNERQPNQPQQPENRRDSTQGSDVPLLEKAAPMAQGGQYVSRTPTLATAQPRVVSGPAYASGITGIDSTLNRPWPGAGPRIISPFEWKSSSSVAHAANLATAFFANSQYDGTAMDLDSDSDAMLTHAAGISGAPTNNATSASTWQHRSASLDGIDSPNGPGSPLTTSPNLSPTTSPRLQPTRSKKGADIPSKKSSPTKGSSPAKAKFEHIASKIGMGGKDHNESNGGASPPVKRGWRDIWPGSSKKDGVKDSSKDDGPPGPASPAR